MIHRIRLGPPWEAVPQGDGRTRHTRRVGRPRLTAEERVYIVAEVAGQAEVTLNGSAIALDSDITESLLPRNALIILSTTEPAGVALEIRSLD